MAEKLLFIKRNLQKKQETRQIRKQDRRLNPEKTMAAEGHILENMEDTEELPEGQRLSGAEQALAEQMSVKYGFVVEQDITYVHTDIFINSGLE